MIYAKEMKEAWDIVGLLVPVLHYMYCHVYMHVTCNMYMHYYVRVWAIDTSIAS